MKENKLESEDEQVERLIREIEQDGNGAAISAILMIRSLYAEVQRLNRGFGPWLGPDDPVVDARDLIATLTAERDRAVEALRKIAEYRVESNMSAESLRRSRESILMLAESAIAASLQPASPTLTEDR